MPKHGRNLSIGFEVVEKPSVHNDLATWYAHRVDLFILDDDHLPVEPIEMPRRRRRHSCFHPVPEPLGHPPVIQKLLVSLHRYKGALGGADDLRGDPADADAFVVFRGEDVGGFFLLETVEDELTEPPFDPGRKEDEVGAVGVRHGLEGTVVGGDGRGAREENPRSSLPPVEEPRESAAASGEVDELRTSWRGVVVAMRDPRPRQRRK